MSHLRTKTETLACAWCGEVADCVGKQSPKATEEEVVIPKGWLAVHVNLQPDTSDHSYFTDRAATHWVCSDDCKVESYEAGDKARVAYAETWDALCPRRQKQEQP